MAKQLIENLAEQFDPSKYHDEYEDKLHEIIKAKAKGKKLDVASAREPEQTQVVDLVTRLQESLAASAGGKRPRGASKAGEGGDQVRRGPPDVGRPDRRRAIGAKYHGESRRRRQPLDAHASADRRNRVEQRRRRGGDRFPGQARRADCRRSRTVGGREHGGFRALPGATHARALGPTF